MQHLATHNKLEAVEILLFGNNKHSCTFVSDFVVCPPNMYAVRTCRYPDRPPFMVKELYL